MTQRCLELDYNARKVIELGLNGLKNLDKHEILTLIGQVTKDQESLKDCWGKLHKKIYDHIEATCTLAKLLLIAVQLEENEYASIDFPETMIEQAKTISKIERISSLIEQLEIEEAVEQITEQDIEEIINFEKALYDIKLKSTQSLASLINEMYARKINKIRELLGATLFIKPDIIYGYLLEKNVTGGKRISVTDEVERSQVAYNRGDSNFRSHNEVSDWEVIDVAKRHYGYITATWLINDLKLWSIDDANKIIQRITRRRGIFRKREPLAYELKKPFSQEKIYIIESARQGLVADILRILEKEDKAIHELLSELVDVDIKVLEDTLKELEMGGIISYDMLTGKWGIKLNFHKRKDIG